jgi:uncharacterized protein YutE (UPF0331/DUF86 family)
MDRLGNDILNRLFSEMDDALQKLNGFSKFSKEEFLAQERMIDAAKYDFIVAIEAMIDICNRIISMDKLGYPQDYSDVIRLMGEKGKFQGDLVKQLVEMVRFRNVLVHLYWKVEDDKLYEYLRNNLGDFEVFKSAIRNYLKSKKE